MLALLFQLILWPLRLPLTALGWLVDRARRPRLVLTIDLEGRHPARPENTGPWSAPAGISRRALRRQVDRALADPRVEAVRVRVGPLQGGRAALYEIRQQIRRLREAGKTVVAFVAMPDTRALWVASAANEVLIPQDAPVMATGIGVEMSFYGEALERLGVELQVLAHGRFKSAMEPFVRRAPSDANREAIDALLDDLYATLIADIAEGRGHAVEAVMAAFETGIHSPDAAVAAGLVDGVIAEEDLDERLGCGPKGPARAVEIGRYRGRPAPLPALRLRKPALAVVEVKGAIRDGRHADPAPRGAVTRAVVGALERARTDKRVKGVLLHVDSRGGSAMASERMWRAVRRVAADKPVIAWMGDVAASGGYYVASAAHGIVATPGTLTGSIGVIAAKPVVARLLERMGINRVRFERGPQSTVFSLARPFSETEQAALQESIARTYDLFLRRAAEGRDRTTTDIDAVGQGRVWTGAQALEHGLVDALGDEGDAVRLLAERAGIPAPRWLRRIGPKVPWRHRLRPRLGVVIPQLSLLELGRESDILAWCPVDPG